MDFLRTPDSQFGNLPDYPFKARYVDVHGLRMHYVDEGPPDAPVVLLPHGEPGWSYPIATRSRVAANARGRKTCRAPRANRTRR